MIRILSSTCFFPIEKCTNTLKNEEGEESAVDGIAAGAGMSTEGEMSLAPLLDRPSVSSNKTFFGRHSDQQENKNDCDIKTFYVGRN